MMWQGPGFSMMLVVSNLRTPIRHTPYLQSTQTRSALNGAGWMCVFHIYHLLFVSMKGGKGETLALVLPEEFAFIQADVVHLVGRAAPVGPVPLVSRARPTLPETEGTGLIGHVGKD